MKEPLLANFIIAGVNKAGSTSLFHYLSEHPDICGSRDKETCYFLPILYGRTPGPISQYAAQFTDCKHSKYRMEATPAYFFGKEKIAQAIKDQLGEVKILIILKDPVERLISFYKRKKATLQLPATLSFKEYVQQCLNKSPEQLASLEYQLFTGIELGKYDEYITPWMEIYGANIKVMFFDDLVDNPHAFMGDICTWLGISPDFYASYEFGVKNKSLGYKYASMRKFAVRVNKAGNLIWRKNPALKEKLLDLYYKLNGKPFNEATDQETIQKLRNYFVPHNIRLREILSSYGMKDLPEWLAVPETVAA